MKVTSVTLVAATSTTSSSSLRPSSHINHHYRNPSSFFFILILWNIAVIPYYASVVSVAAMSTSNIPNNNPASNPAAAAAVSSSDEAVVAVAKNTIDFLTMAGGLKTTPRTGWVMQEAGPRIESVADHSWRIGLMAMVASSASSSSSSSPSKYDTNRCIKMALVHDLAEAKVGDITPHCGVSDDDKHARELKAITEMTQKLTNLPGMISSSEEDEKGDASSSSSSSTKLSPVGQEILELWKEYEAGVTEEAKLVKDMDKLEMILQALEYETDGKNKKSLDGFFDGTRGKWKTPIGEAWGKEIESRRSSSKISSSAEENDDSKPPAEKKTKL